MKYQFKQSWFRDLDPQIIGEHLESLIEKHNEHVGWNEIVVDARRHASPIRDAFEWDDATAAEKYRINQAKLLARSLRTKPASGKRSTRAFVFLKNPDQHGARSLFTTQSAMRRPELREQVIERAFKELDGWFARYAGFARVRNNKATMQKLRDRLEADLLAAR